MVDRTEGGASLEKRIDYNVRCVVWKREGERERGRGEGEGGRGGGGGGGEDYV